MPPFEIVPAKLTGNPDSSGWTQVHDFTPQDEEVLEKRGRFFAVVTTSNTTSSSDTIISGREIVFRLHESYYGETEKSAFIALKSAVENVSKEFSNIDSGIEIAAVALLIDVVYCSVNGGSEIAILRDGKVFSLIKARSHTVSSASGKVAAEDTLIMGTSAFYKKFTHGFINASLINKAGQDAAEVFAPAVHSQGKSGNIGVVFVKFQEGIARESIPPRTFIEKPKRAVNAFPVARSLRFDAGAVKSRLSKTFSSIFKKEVHVRVTGEEVFAANRRKNISAGFGVIVLMALLLSVFLGIRQKNTANVRAQYESRLAEVQHNLTEAISLASIDKARSRELFAYSRQLAEEMVLEGIVDPELEKVRKQILENQGELLGEYKVTPETFVDLSLLSDGFNAEESVVNKETLYILDKKGKKIISVNLNTKRSQVEAGPGSVQEATSLAVNNGRVMVGNSEGVFEVTSSRRQMSEVSLDSGDLLYAYAANLYVLSKNNSMIWRFVGTDSGYAGRKDWLAQGTEEDFTSVEQWVIDGAVWTLSGTGDVMKFSNGVKQNFSIREVYPEITALTAFYTNEELEELYFLDNENARIVVTTKTGEFVAQYISEGIKDATFVAVSSSVKRAVLVSGDKLYSFDLQH